MEKKLSVAFGLMIGSMWVGEMLLGNLAGTATLGNVGESHPRIYSLGMWFALGAVVLSFAAGLAATFRTGSAAAGLRVGLWSGLISGAIGSAFGMSIILLFHNAMMSDPSNAHEFARTAHRAPTEAELSSFLYWDGLGGMVNHLWLGPLLGVVAGGIGAVFGKLRFLGEQPSGSPAR